MVGFLVGPTLVVCRCVLPKRRFCQCGVCLCDLVISVQSGLCDWEGALCLWVLWTGVCAVG